MAHDALHLFFLDRVAQSPRLPPEAAALLRQYRGEAEVGALLIDLPYFEGFGAKVVGHFTGTQDAPSPWGDRLHQQMAMGLLRGLLDAARDEQNPGTLRAIALGHFSHVVLDRLTHPHVNRFVRQGAGAEPHQLHRQVENAQLELWHRAELRRPLFGHRGLLRLVGASTPLLRGRAVAGGLARAVRLAAREAPSLGQWRRWVLGLWEYAMLVASPVGRGYVPEHDIERLRIWFDGPELDFRQLWERAVVDCVEGVGAVWQLVGQSDGLQREVFAAAFPEENLDYPEQPPLAG